MPNAVTIPDSLARPGRALMPELGFSIEGAAFDRHAASAYVDFVLEIESLDSRVSICGVLLDCQVRIEARRRRYAAAEHARLAELFGEPARWGVTMKDLLWAYASIKVPAFDGMTGVRLPIPCSFDFNLG